MGDWKAALVEEARSRWQTGKLLLLSQIPRFLKTQGIEPTDVQAGRSLLNALRMDCAQELSLFQDPKNAAVWAAIPSDVGAKLQGPDVFSSFRRTSDEASSPTESSSVKFKPWFWAAFVKPIENGKRRWILSNRYLDESTPDNRGDLTNAREVVSDDIRYPGPEQPVNKSEVSAAIEDWATRNQVDLSDFEADQPEPKAHQPLKHLSFESLDISDLRRISVPLDIVMKLITRR